MGRHPSSKTLVDRQLGRNIKNPILPTSDGFVIPNHDGDHSAGTTGTPVNDKDLANKAYIDSSIFWNRVGTILSPKESGDTINVFELTLNDNNKIKLGTGADMEIYHDSINSRISNSTGTMVFRNTSGAVAYDFYASGYFAGSDPLLQITDNGSFTFNGEGVSGISYTFVGSSGTVMSLSTTTNDATFQTVNSDTIKLTSSAIGDEFIRYTTSDGKIFTWEEWKTGGASDVGFFREGTPVMSFFNQNDDVRFGGNVLYGYNTGVGLTLGKIDDWSTTNFQGLFSGTSGGAGGFGDGDLLFQSRGNNARDIEFATNNGTNTATRVAIKSAGNLSLYPMTGQTTNGDFWNDSTQKTLQTFVAGIEQSLNGCIFTQTADKVIEDTTTATTMFGTGVGTLTIPADFWTLGKTIKIKIYGNIEDNSTPTARIKGTLSGTPLVDSGAITLKGLSSVEEWQCEMIMTCRTIGSSGKIQTVINWEYETTTGSSPIERLNIPSTLTTIDTTLSDTIDITFQWGTKSISNILTSKISTIKVLN